ncbi:hypothetical protein [Teichococcus aestuarii]|uniref:Uncharacterized protein n=1 Tax=Teichococcus aestuarii TaxID=568898 RepID=A0A2U1UYA9_9PROT|nr:hypothetical protein [Pseudoroseomonas aestuarii]PWC26630.1 hypothetical protein CR165_22050 [Pseudoroseomonas aestuarii]
MLRLKVMIELETLGITQQPLNLAGNTHHPFHPALRALRSGAAAQAALLPIAPRGGPRRALA